MTLVHLSDDLLCEALVYGHLTVTDIAALRETCRRWHALLADDELMRRVAVRDWGHAFWEEAMRRPAVASCPCATWWGELRRIEGFQRHLRSLGQRPYTHDDFTGLWRSQARVWARG